MEELHKIVKKKYKYFDITPQHLGQVIRDNNITRKRTRHKHYPKERYGKPTDITAIFKKSIVFLKIAVKEKIKKIILKKNNVVLERKLKIGLMMHIGK